MKQKHAAFLVVGLVAIPIAAGAALARLVPWETRLAPWETRLAPWESGQAAVSAEPQIATPVVREAAPVDTAALEAATFAPALRLRSFLPASDPDASQAFVPSASSAESPVLSTVSLAAVSPDAAASADLPADMLLSAPPPPVRPRELLSLLAPPLPPARPGDLEGSISGGRVQLASLAAGAPAGAVAPGVKPQLVEPAPTFAPAPTIADKPPAPDVPFAMGQQAYVRIFKKEGELELWLRRGDRLALYKTYAVCKWSGHLGPKKREGDLQSPEGFYSVSAKQLHPKSKYYRAFNVGFPNALDKQLGYTGGALMVHGSCQSVGCFAMTDRNIDEIYNYVAAAIGRGQKEVPVHIFPFRMTAAKLASETSTGLLAFASNGQEQYAPFWRNLKEGYDLFEKTGEPPQAYACNGRYAFNASSACKRIAGW
ncbi:MAG: L,D-transpeptidase family protein [Rhodoblastus sp.]